MYTDSSQTMDLEITAKHPLKFVMITRTVAHLSFFLIGGVLHIRRLRARYFHISAAQSKLETATTAIVVSDLYPLYSSACRFLHLICGSGGSTCSRKVANRCLNHPRTSVSMSWFRWYKFFSRGVRSLLSESDPSSVVFSDSFAAAAYKMIWIKYPKNQLHIFTDRELHICSPPVDIKKKKVKCTWLSYLSARFSLVMVLTKL